MKPGILHIIFRTISYYRKPVIYQIIIVTLLSAVITGSMLTGYSVRHSLMKSAEVKLGKTDLLTSSGLRYFQPTLAERFGSGTGIKCTPVLETSGFCRNLKTGIKSLNINIYGITGDFFSFQGKDNIRLDSGEVAINSTLGNRLKITIGDEIVVSFRSLSDIPPNSPFAPSAGNSSLVLKVGIILPPDQCGSFSLGISQLTPENVFINLSDIAEGTGLRKKVNRILIEAEEHFSVEKASAILKRVLLPDNVGLTARRISKTGETEIISSRIFIDRQIYEEIKRVIPSAYPLLTYLSNSFNLNEKSTPYSFVSALDTSGVNDIQPGDRIVINRWLAEDLNASVNDTVTLAWFTPGKIIDLEEKSEKFVVSKIVDQKGVFSDSLLMPEFPGIAGKESCSDWDAGVKIKMDRIRKKDEDYWKEFRGTPKAFISYEKGRSLWGNNFGPMTAVRFPSAVNEKEITQKLAGNLDPDQCGFQVKDLKADMINAAKKSVDFTTLFISLGFFIILACIILLSLTVTSFLDSRKKQISTLFALGFRNSWINRLLFLETGFMTLLGSLSGAFLGLFINWLIILALNSVWIGAVQTDTLKVFPDFNTLVAGFFITTILTFIFLLVKLRRYAENLNKIKTGKHSMASSKLNRILLLIFISVSLVLLILMFTSGKGSAIISFSAGMSVFAALMLLWKQYVIGGLSFRKKKTISEINLSGRYFSFYPSHAMAPILFIAAGLFAVIVTGINRLGINERNLGASGGTGGYLLWAETAIPVKEDLNSVTGKRNFGLDEGQMTGLSFVQARRSSGDDASCLNLNHIESPPLLGINPESFIRKGSFSFSSLIAQTDKSSPWRILTKATSGNIIYGFADQTVLEWGLNKKTGDTLKMKAESGQLLNIVVAGGLKSTVFQGYLLISEANFTKYFPSVPGSSVFLVDGKSELSDSYTDLLNTRFENYGINVVQTKERLASFFKVTNTYLSVFSILGGLGMILGVIGLGFVLKRNYNFRRKEFALLMATGFNEGRIKRLILREQVFILAAGVVTGILSPVIATFSSIRNGFDIPWMSILLLSVFLTLIGLVTLLTSVREVTESSLVASLRLE